MTIGIIIAVGGTGAKVAESIVHAAAAGLGPSELLVGFVDQDQGNGNTDRARRSVEMYRDARAVWRDQNTHCLDDQSPLLRTKIDLLRQVVPIWTQQPHRGTNVDLAFGIRY